ncbi:hypothetical protein TEQG_08794 [Trichophyton equinum CBS 127.97]|uniref:Uncharacterized protein n=1 Tax=Trichophyton equinum (strain ATCC MYA-4606 / CBS 127.97) TaxID=559882 RepID=F2Q2X6_TRIEC|nr:hypothetical protein TEQG_08794 [Trichophyton equinum CBS 127.97]
MVTEVLAGAKAYVLYIQPTKDNRKDIQISSIRTNKSVSGTTSLNIPEYLEPYAHIFDRRVTIAKNEWQNTTNFWSNKTKKQQSLEEVGLKSPLVLESRNPFQILAKTRKPKESERVLAQSKKRALEDSPSKAKNQKEDKVPKTQAFNFSLSNTHSQNLENIIKLIEWELETEKDRKALEILENQKSQFQQLIKYKQKKVPTPKTLIQLLEERILELEKNQSSK